MHGDTDRRDDAAAEDFARVAAGEEFAQHHRDADDRQHRGGQDLEQADVGGEVVGADQVQRLVRITGCQAHRIVDARGSVKIHMSERSAALS
ncbi:hypothetical protein GCM10009715_25650 [Paeniglutamicibacter psychrophenolicus]